MQPQGSEQGRVGHQQKHEQHQGQGVPVQQPQQYYNPHHMAQMPPNIYGYPMEGWGPHGGQSGYQHTMYAGYQYPVQMEGVPLPPGIPGLGGSTDPLEAVLGPFPCVRLRNLPFEAAIEDILLFFQGLVLIDVVMVGHGEAFVIFANPMDFQMALQRNRQTIGRRFVEISVASRSDYYEAVAAMHEQERGPKFSSTALSTGSGGSGAVGGLMQQRGDSVAVRGEEPQPSGESTTTSSVAGLWSSSGSTPIQGMQGLAQAGTAGPSSFESSMAAQQSLAAATSGMVSMAGGGPTGRGGPPPQPPRAAGGLHAPLQKRTGGGIQIGEHTGFLRMRGLPFAASKEDIIKFFSGYNPVPDSVVLTYRNDGRATGEAYVGFATPDDSKRAMELHRRSMGNRYIELFISNKDEQGRALARFGSR